MEQLFYKTNFPPDYQKAIWSDINAMRKRYPHILYSRYDTSPYSVVLLQGYADFINRGQKCILPLNMRLPAKFPREAPIVELPFPPNFRFFPSQVLQPNKIVNVNMIIQWAPMKTTLPMFIDSLVQFFQNYPPFDPSENYILQQMFNVLPSSSPTPGVTPDIQNEAIAQADSYVQELNKKMDNCTRAKKEAALTKQFLTTVSNKNQNLKGEVNSLEEKARKMDGTPAPEYQIDPQTDQGFSAKASTSALASTVEELRNQFRNHKISADEYLKSIKSLHRKYFDTTIYPRCTTM